MTREEIDELARTDPDFTFRDGIPNPSDEVCPDVLPEKVPLPLELVRTIGTWHSMADAFEKLWLQSGAYEEMAARELCDPESALNRAGMEAGA